MSKLQIDRATKELLEDIADYFGCKPDTIRDVWEATLIVWLHNQIKALFPLNIN